MSLRVCRGLSIGLAFLVGLTNFNLVPVACAKEGFVRDLLLSLARPVESSEPVVSWGEEIDRIISGRSWGAHEEGTSDSREVLIPFREDYFAASPGERAVDFPAREYLFPGSESLDRVAKSLTRLAAAGHGSRLLDAHDRLAPIGSFVADATRVFSRLEIQVEKATYTVTLVGIKKNGESKILFSCKAGLGSPDYPTPRGVFFIERIFDDNPWWIPPDRPWAWGESPSRTVYGGHMMPLFIKKRVAEPKLEEEVTDLDCIEGPMQMIDSGGYRVHGTNSPWSIGSGQSHGCVRLLNKSVKQIADLLKMYAGTRVRDQSANGTFVKLARPVRLILY